MKKILLLFTVMMTIAVIGCKKETDEISLINGLWIQTEVLEDGKSMALTDCEKQLKLLVEQNGIYRLYNTCNSTLRYGTWLISGTDMLDMSLDRWDGKSKFSEPMKYEAYPVRFTITKLSSSELEIRIKTFIGDRKRYVMFTPIPQENLTGKTAEELFEIDRINKTLVTYIYRFQRQN